MGGMIGRRVEGTPQGGPLSPLLSNILLDDPGKELERRGHAFCRYADDCNIYVRTLRSGERVLVSISRFVSDKLKLKVNAAKSGVGHPWKRKFLGYSMTWHKKPRLKVASAVVKRLKVSVKILFTQGRGRSLRRTIAEPAPKLRGVAPYFRPAEVKTVFAEVDAWLGHKLRTLQSGVIGNDASRVRRS